jgi:hypothetical protein
VVHIGYALDDWYFARDFVHRARPEVDERLDRLARELVKLARESDADEIVVDGHSLGAPLSLVVVDRACNSIRSSAAAARFCIWFRAALRCLKSRCIRKPAGCATWSAGWRTRRLFIGSSIRRWSTSSMSTRSIRSWRLGLPPAGKPIVKIIRIRLMVEEHTYRRFHFNFLRIHRQAVMGNERRYFYDYYMLCCGPIALADRVENPDQMVTAFAADGALIGIASPSQSARAGRRGEASRV